ncbi:MAG: hypothetical protein IJX37_04095 [Oscillospiraceae bacterium]|nr:hypothetical protein [Oscillospiraceae bacterium]
MKIAIAVLLITGLLSGCGAGDDAMDQAMALRKRLLEADSCAFQAVVTADYADALYTFQLECETDNAGNLQFTVTDPETIAGITGSISQDSAALTFDDKVLAFPMLADGELTPVSAPWIFINTLRCGYITGCSKEEKGLCIYIDDSFREKPLSLMLYTDQDCTPVFAEIVWQEQRILSVDVRYFTIQ